jgi:hypothetical protein
VTILTNAIRFRRKPPEVFTKLRIKSTPEFHQKIFHMQAALGLYTSWGYFDPGKSNYVEPFPSRSGELAVVAVTISR